MADGVAAQLAPYQQKGWKSVNLAQPFSSRAEVLGALAAHTLEPTSIATPGAEAVGLTGSSNTVHVPARGRCQAQLTPRPHRGSAGAGGRDGWGAVRTEPKHLPPTPCPCIWGHRKAIAFRALCSKVQTGQWASGPWEPLPLPGQISKRPITRVPCTAWTLAPKHLPSEPLSTRGTSFWAAAGEAATRAAPASASSPSRPPRARPFSEA